MQIRQLSVFIENKPGRLFAAMDILAKNGINISVLSIADTSEFGILRLIVNDPDKAKAVLKDAGIVVKVSNVVAIAMDDVPGGSVDILRSLAEASLNVEYIYACVCKPAEKALMIIRTDDSVKAENVLRANGHCDIDPSDIYCI